MTRLALLTLTCGAPTIASAQAQGLPTTQPTFVTIIREEVKVGRTAEHARIESGWPAAFGSRNSPDYYLSMVSLTGLPEAWYIIPSASQTAYAQSMNRYDSDAAMTAELDRLSRADADVINSSRTIQAVARPDLSMGAYPDLSKQRFWEITLGRVRPGHEADFGAAAKAYGTAAPRPAPPRCPSAASPRELTFTGWWADRRAGTDRRSDPRRQSVAVVAEERRRIVDRRRGAERRSTLDRRGRLARVPNAERPVEHVRNALQLLKEVALTGELSAGASEDLGAAIERLHRAGALLERPRAK